MKEIQSIHKQHEEVQREGEKREQDQDITENSKKLSDKDIDEYLKKFETGTKNQKGDAKG